MPEANLSRSFLGHCLVKGAIDLDQPHREMSKLHDSYYHKYILKEISELKGRQIRARVERYVVIERASGAARQLPHEASNKLKLVVPRAKSLPLVCTLTPGFNHDPLSNR